MPDILIRNMTPEDHEAFARSYTDLHQMHHGAMPDVFRPSVSLPPPDVFETDLKRPDREFFAAEIGGKMAGMCDMVLKVIPDDPKYPLSPGKSAHINDLYVSPEFRRLGVATSLYREAERRARAFGADKITLMVWAFNKAALEFYRKLGMDVSFYQMETKL